MKRITLIAITAILTLATTAFADVKIKSRQTMSGQTSENTTYIKGKRSRTEMMNGMMVSITMCDLGHDLQLNPQTKTYMVNLYDDGTVSEPTQVNASGKSVPVTRGGTMYLTTTIKDTGERRQMFGFTARHIIQTVETESSPDSCSPTKSKMEMDMWVIDAEFGLTCAQNRTYQQYNPGKSGGCRDKIVPKTIGSGKTGYPLIQKMTMFDENGKESFTSMQEVIELSKATLDQALFEAPADYRQVKDASQMYAVGDSSVSSYGNSVNSDSNPSSGMSSNVRNAATKSTDSLATVGAKQPGTVRIGIAVKTTAVGEGITETDLSAAVQNTLGEYLKGTKIEIVPLEAKLAAAQVGEAKEKQCDFVLNIAASHKKGGGGFGGFGKMLGNVVSQTGGGSWGNTVANNAGRIAANTIVTAASVSGNIKSKDELSFDLKLLSASDSSTALAKQFKSKAKSDGDDVISAVVEQVAQAILDAVGK